MSFLDIETLNKFNPSMEKPLIVKRYDTLEEIKIITPMIGHYCAYIRTNYSEYVKNETLNLLCDLSLRLYITKDEE